MHGRGVHAGEGTGGRERRESEGREGTVTERGGCMKEIGKEVERGYRGQYREGGGTRGGRHRA